MSSKRHPEKFKIELANQLFSQPPHSFPVLAWSAQSRPAHGIDILLRHVPLPRSDWSAYTLLKVGSTPATREMMSILLKYSFGTVLNRIFLVIKPLTE